MFPLVILLSNILIFLFWLRIVADSRREAVFNPFVASPLRLANRMTDFLRPVCFGLPDRAIAVCGLLFLLIFRGALLYNTLTPDAPWVVRMSAGFFDRQAIPGRLSSCMLFSCAGFFGLVYTLWCLDLLTHVMAGLRRRDRASEALRYLSRPFSARPLPIQCGILLLGGIAYAAVLDLAGDPSTSPLPAVTGITPVVLAWSNPVLASLQLVCVSVAGLAEVLLLAQNAMLIMIMISLFSSFSSSRKTATMANEGMALLLGRFASLRARLGPVDFTPIIYYIAAAFARHFIVLLLSSILEYVS